MGPGTAPVSLSSYAALGDGCWHPPAFNTADLGWRKRRPGPGLAWPGPRGQFPQNSFPLRGWEQAGPSMLGRWPTALPSIALEQLCQKDSQIWGCDRGHCSALDLFSH